MPVEVHSKIMHWVKRGGQYECSGMFKVKVEGEIITVVDAWMAKQTNSGGETEMDAESLCDLLYKTRDVEGVMYGWWHNHNTMGVFWSGTDRDQINKMAQNGGCVAIVFNLRGEMKCCVAAGAPFYLHMDDVEVVIDRVVNKDQAAAWDKEFDENVTVKTWSNMSYLGGDYVSRSLMHDYDDWNERWEWRNGAYHERTSPGPVVSTALGRGAVHEAPAELDQVTQVTLRLKQIDRDLDVLEWALRARQVNRAVCQIIDVQWEKGLELDTPIEGMQKDKRKYTIRDSINDTMTDLIEEQNVLDEGLEQEEIRKEIESGTQGSTSNTPN